MTTLYVYDAENYENYILRNAKLQEPIACFEGESNQECEQLAREANYDDCDQHAWSYRKWSN